MLITYRSLLLFQTSPTPTGVSIPYPTIALHATMKWKSTVDALYMNLSLNDAETVNDEEDIKTLELTLLH
jgi:nucleotide-sensitive chloride channel 1A